MSVVTQSGALSTVPAGTAISTTPGDGGVVQVMQSPALEGFNATAHADLLTAILTELRVVSYLLQSGLNVRDELDVLRADPSFSSL